jgi:hypothetical protein
MSTTSTSERQGGVGRDRPGPVVPVRQLGPDVEVPPLAQLDADEPLVPRGDHEAGAELEAEGLPCHDDSNVVRSARTPT